MRRSVRGAIAGGAGPLAVVAGLFCSVGVPAEAGSTPAQVPQTDGRVYIVQALPDAEVSVAVDGGAPTEDVGTSEIVGPLRLAPGQHDITVEATDGSWQLESSVNVSSGGSSDVVLHRPASPSGRPVVTVYQAPLAPVAQDKGRLLLAHTATVPPADVRLDGEVAFANIANGEFVEAEVPSGEITAAIVPTGRKGPALLGPIPLELPALTLTSVYAIGSPSNGSMDVVVHQLPLRQRGSQAPDEINTGAAGLVDGVRVKTFGATRASASAAVGLSTRATSPAPPAAVLGAVTLVLTMLGVGLTQRRRRPAGSRNW